jgi:hypothetical protein
LSGCFTFTDVFFACNVPNTPLWPSHRGEFVINTLEDFTMRLMFTTCLAALTLIAGCGRHNDQPSRLKLEVQVPGEQLNSDGVTRLMDALETIKTTGQGTVTVAELLALIPFTAAEFATIAANRDDSATITCSGSICTGTNSGHAQEMDVSKMNLPGFGVPHIAIADDVKLKFRLGNPRVLDICSIEGFSIQKFLVWSPLVSARVNLNEGRHATDGNIIGSPTTVTRCN